MWKIFKRFTLHLEIVIRNRNKYKAFLLSLSNVNKTQPSKMFFKFNACESEKNGVIDKSVAWCCFLIQFSAFLTIAQCSRLRVNILSESINSLEWWRWEIINSQLNIFLRSHKFTLGTAS